MFGYILIVAAGMFIFLGDAPSWRRTILGLAAALVIGMALDVALPIIAAAPDWRVRNDVLVPLFGIYGLSFSALVSLPVALVATAVAAHRRWTRKRDPNDLRR